MDSSHILIVDDDKAHRNMLKTILHSWDFIVEEACSGEEAVECVHNHAFDVVLTDIRMNKMDGMEALKAILSYNPYLPVVMMTAYSSVETAVDAMRIGAYDYLVKPLDFDLLKETLEQGIKKSHVSTENRELRRQLTEQSDIPTILGRSDSIRTMLHFIETVAPTEATVLITGESGTGKELIAKALHRASGRSTKPMVTVNCAALTETLLESELFGHEKGAFTGADKRRDGRFVQADGGTLFLDEIGEIPLTLQAKLLRALQQGEVQRVGSDVPIHVDVRVIAATNRDLGQEVRDKRFRSDLFFRLNVISIEAPPLRKRVDDIPLLASHFLQTFATRNNKNIKDFSAQAMDCLLRYPWPGNVRELENAIERAVILCRGDLICRQDLPVNISNTDIDVDKAKDGQDQIGITGMSLDMIERQAIESTLQQTDYNKSEAARRLGITRATLHNKLRKYNID